MATLAELTSEWWEEHLMAKIGAHVVFLEDAMIAAVQSDRREIFDQMKELHGKCCDRLTDLMLKWEGGTKH